MLLAIAYTAPKMQPLMGIPRLQGLALLLLMLRKPGGGHSLAAATVDDPTASVRPDRTLQYGPRHTPLLEFDAVGAASSSSGGGHGPGVVLLQEWWGVTPEILTQAQRLAAAGYRVVVPDLYRGSTGVDAAEASHLMTGLDWGGAVEDIRAAARYLDQPDPAAQGGGGLLPRPNVGVVGFCMGGALALVAAVNVTEIDAAVSFYGVRAMGRCS